LHPSSWSRRATTPGTLNAKTINDKFPIPVVEELREEMHRTTCFTKLDHRSSYHQVLMHPDDVNKTVFHTHKVLFEFLVMPFRLTNMLVTLQALMNELLQPFLRWFILVFFTDILIFNISWSEQLRHVHPILAQLQKHHLFVKKSKCTFGMHSVAYRTWAM
jgi:hypothetical protein